MKDIVEWDVKHLNTKKQAFGAFKAVRHRMVENYLGIEQNLCSFCADAHAVRGVFFDLGQRVKIIFINVSSNNFHKNLPHRQLRIRIVYW